MLWEGSRSKILSLMGIMFLIMDLVSPEVGPEQAYLVFYYGPDFTDSMSLKLTEATKLLDDPRFQYNETHFYLHGYQETQDSESIHVIFDAYSKREINLVTVDWGVAAGENYLQAALQNIEKLAPALADVFLNLFNAGLERESTSIVAHSLGAQLAGRTGREFIKKTNGREKIYRMALLDAAFPLFSVYLWPFTVNNKVAQHVQAIHTDIGTYGQPIPLGHVDFWPNGGRQGQPGCPSGFILPFSEEDLCSHQRSWRFWAESVANANGPRFWSFPSSKYYQYVLQGVENFKDEAIEMGYNCPIGAKGNYYLKTNSQPPYARGFDMN